MSRTIPWPFILGTGVILAAGLLASIDGSVLAFALFGVVAFATAALTRMAERERRRASSISL